MNHDNADLPAQFCGGDFPSPSGFFQTQGRCVSLCKQCGAFLGEGVGPDANIGFPLKCICFAATFGFEGLGIGGFDSVGDCIQCFRGSSNPNLDCL
jgi:hypothetical protein